MSILIRVAGPRGRLAATQLRRAVFVSELGQDTDVVFDGRDAESLLIIASEAETPIASARLLIEMGDDDLERAEMAWLAVLPEHRRKGIGIAVLNALESEALRRGLDALWCAVPEALTGVVEREGYAQQPDGRWMKSLW